MLRLWPILVPLTGIVAALVIWRSFADDLNLTGNARTIYTAIIAGIAIVGTVKVLMRLSPRAPSGLDEFPKPDRPQHIAPKAPERRGDD